MLYKTQCPSPLGPLTLASDGTNLTGLWLLDQKYYGATLSPDAAASDSLPLFLQVQDWLQRYFSGLRPSPAELPLAPQGSDFRRTVWKLLAEIPYGNVMTYGDIAREIAKICGRNSMPAQAVGGAVGHNPISIVLPCHRVVGTNGSLTGYAGGLEAKIKLLTLEGVPVDAFSVPSSGRAL